MSNAWKNKDFVQNSKQAYPKDKKYPYTSTCRCGRTVLPSIDFCQAGLEELLQTLLYSCRIDLNVRCTKWYEALLYQQNLDLDLHTCIVIFVVHPRRVPRPRSTWTSQIQYRQIYFLGQLFRPFFVQSFPLHFHLFIYLSIFPFLLLFDFLLEIIRNSLVFN